MRDAPNRLHIATKDSHATVTTCLVEAFAKFEI